MSDVLLATVSMQEQSGADWVIFQLGFQIVVEESIYEATIIEAKLSQLLVACLQ